MGMLKSLFGGWGWLFGGWVWVWLTWKNPPLQPQPLLRTLFYTIQNISSFDSLGSQSEFSKMQKKGEEIIEMVTMKYIIGMCIKQEIFWQVERNDTSIVGKDRVH